MGQTAETNLIEMCCLLGHNGNAYGLSEFQRSLFIGKQLFKSSLGRKDKRTDMFVIQ